MDVPSQSFPYPSGDAPEKPRRILLLIPSVMKQGIDASVSSDRHPRMDYYALADELRGRGCTVDLIDYAGLPGGIGGFRDLVLACKGALRAREYDAIFCNSESIALPLGTILKSRRDRPRIVAIGHRISTPKKRAMFTRWRAMDGVDTMFLYASLQLKIGIEDLGIAAEKLRLIQFHADQDFFRPCETRSAVQPPQGYAHQVCSAGLEWRDYPTLVAAAARMPSVHFHIAAASPWSKHGDETARIELPRNVTVKKHDYFSLRELYRASDLCVAPLYETDFQAGITTILEAMACGLPVIASRTSGQTDAIVDGGNGVYVAPGDADAMQAAIESLLSDHLRRCEMGRAARAWLEKHASLEIWTGAIADAIAG